MAKASIGQATQGKEQAPPPVARKKPKVTVADPKRKPAAGKVLAKGAAPKMSPSRGKTAAAKAAPIKAMKANPPASAKTGTKQAVSGKTVAGRSAAAKKAAPGKAASGKAARGKTAAGKTALAKAALGKATPGKATPSKATPGKATPGKAASPRQTPRPAASPAKAAAKPAAKAVRAKQVADRRPAVRSAVPTPAARRPRTAPAPRKSAAPAVRKTKPASAPADAPNRTSANPPQVFTVSHLNQADFKTDGLRSYAKYRDLGIAAATGGLCQAHVIRFTPPCTDAVRKRHVHEADLQLVYVLQGWMKNEFEGHGEQMMSAGSCWLQPSGIKHTVLEYSADCEVLEIVVPADFKTEELT